MKVVNPYLNFPGNTEQAFQHYKSVFGGDFPMVVRFGDFPGNMGVAEQHRDKIAHIALPLGKNGMLIEPTRWARAAASSRSATTSTS